jgi:flagellar biosynthetic protein FliR
MPISIGSGDIGAWLGSLLWPFLRIGALLVAAPVFSSVMVSARLRAMLAVLLAATVAPLLEASPALEPVSVAGMILAAQQVMIGVAMGLVFQFVFMALAVAGEAIALSMGLGFASQLDPANGVQVPVLGSYYGILGTLLFLALDGHLAMLGLLADSFRTLPVGAGGIGREGLWTLVSWITATFAGAVMVALPALIALLIANLCFGVITRATPQLNLFAVGFPLTLILGLIAVMLTLSELAPQLGGLVADALSLGHELAVVR